ncbi:MAG: hypothetical protein IJB17_00715 [Oscillospiraceae bacterium]|nr:hypothetical protein [Oscillospiraceae bacterium]
MRKLDWDFLIDGQPLPVPDAPLELSYQDLDAQAAGRDEAGFMHRLVLREKVRTWALVYGVLSEREYRYVMGLLAGKPTFSFTVRGLDGEPETVKAYCAKVGISYFDRSRGLYKNLRLNVIEC